MFLRKSVKYNVQSNVHSNVIVFISSIFILNLAEIWLPKARYETEISYFDFGIFDKTTKKSLVEFHDSKQRIFIIYKSNEGIRRLNFISICRKQNTGPFPHIGSGNCVEQNRKLGLG